MGKCGCGNRAIDRACYDRIVSEDASDDVLMAKLKAHAGVPPEVEGHWATRAHVAEMRARRLNNG